MTSKGAAGTTVINLVVSDDDEVEIIDRVEEKARLPKLAKRGSTAVALDEINAVDSGGGDENDPFGPLREGETATANGSKKGRVYTIKRTGNTYHCTCPAWMFQKTAPAAGRTCKHINALRSAFPANHVSSSSSTAASMKKGQKRTASSSSGGKKKQGRDTGTQKVEKRAKNMDSGTELFEVALADKYGKNHDPIGYFMSEKLDGVRCIWDGKEKLWTRNWNEIHAPQSFLRSLPPDVVLDGELFFGRQRFQECISIVRSHERNEEKWRSVSLVVFDAPLVDGNFPARLRVAKEALSECKCPTDVARMHPQTMCTGRDHASTELDAVIKLGGEGVMLRKPSAPYRGGRTSDLLKAKKFHDAEAIVTGHVPGKGKHTGRLGALMCKMTNSAKTFKLGTGFSDAQREDPPPIGATVTYRYFELTKAGVPRFPTFVRVRQTE